MQIQCPNCKVMVSVPTETFLVQNHVMCNKCMFTIELRNMDGTLKHLQISMEEEKQKKENSG